MIDNQKAFRAALARCVAAGYEAQEVAAAMGIHKNTLSRLKRNDHSPVPSIMHVLSVERVARMMESGRRICNDDE